MIIHISSLLLDPIDNNHLGIIENTNLFIIIGEVLVFESFEVVHAGGDVNPHVEIRVDSEDVKDSVVDEGMDGVSSLVCLVVDDLEEEVLVEKFEEVLFPGL